ncbi:MAG: flippase [Butyrivibrio sp.]
MKAHSIKKNFMLSTAYQLLLMFTPLITTPYVSRVLGAEGVGIYSYTLSVQTYFALFAALGVDSYGTREIARNRDCEEKRSRLFWEIELLTVVTSLVCIAVWGIVVALSGRYKVFYRILTLNIIAVPVNISWFYTGIEQFRHIVVQNSIFKLLGVIAVFAFVKDSEDVAVYMLIMSLATLLANISMWVRVPLYVRKISFKSLDIKKHFRETIVYFIPTIATSIYTVLDKTLLGLIVKSDRENGYYEQASKIVNMMKAVTFTALNNVLGARISYLFAGEKYDEIKERIKFSMDYIFFMGIGICFGLTGVAPVLVPLLLGPGYDRVVTLIRLLSPIVLIVGVSSCLGMQYYNPVGLRKRSAGYIIAGSAVNLVLNLLLIPRYAGYGAAVASIAAETVIMVLYLRNCSGFMTAGICAGLAWKKLIAGILMAVLVIMTGRIVKNRIAAAVCQVTAGVLFYTGLLFLMRDSFVTAAAERLRYKFIRKKVGENSEC